LFAALTGIYKAFYAYHSLEIHTNDKMNFVVCRI